MYIHWVAHAFVSLVHYYIYMYNYNDYNSIYEPIPYTCNYDDGMMVLAETKSGN